jgi:putative flavoprotein involved in K+ transport
MFMRTPQPGLWFIAGSLAQCRIYSKYMALQIKALEAGLLGHSQAGSGLASANRLSASGFHAQTTSR